MKRPLLIAAALVALLVGCTAPVQLRYPDARIVQCGPFVGAQGYAAREAKEAKAFLTLAETRSPAAPLRD